MATTEYRVTELHPIDAGPLVSAGWSATITLADGTTLGVSHVDTDPVGVWGVDSLFRGNGYPVFCHGEGARYCTVQTLKDDICGELDKLVREAS
jgi:hypothetical protein